MLVKFGHSGSTRTDELTKIGKGLFGGRYLGTFAQDKLPDSMYNVKQENYALINVDTTGMPGTHWVAVSGLPDTEKILVFDSFGRASKSLLPTLRGGNVIDTEYDKEQKRIQDSCGQYAMAWLIFRDKYGAKNAQKI